MSLTELDSISAPLGAFSCQQDILRAHILTIKQRRTILELVENPVD